MNSIVNAMPKYDHRQHVLSDWLAELDQRFQLGEVGEDTNRITWCQLLIGVTGSGILSSLDEDATWEDAKEALLTRLDIGSVRDKAWAALKTLKKGSKDIVELATKAEKLAKKLHPRDKETAVDAFLGALDRTLAAEVQKLGHWTLEDIVAATHRIKKILEEQTDTKMELLVSAMQDQTRLLKKDLKKANEQIYAHRATALPVAAMAAVPAPAEATAAAAQPPPATSARHIYQDYCEEPPFYLHPRHQIDRRPPCCFLCGDEGHFVSNCPARPFLQRLLRKQAPASAPGLLRGRFPLQPQRAVKLLDGSPEAKVTPVGCTVGPPITGQLNLEGIPVLELANTGALVTCMGFSAWR